MKKIRTIVVVGMTLLVGMLASGCAKTSSEKEVADAIEHRERMENLQLAASIRAAAAPSRVYCGKDTPIQTLLSDIGEGKERRLVGNVWYGTDHAGRVQCWDGPGIDGNGAELKRFDKNGMATLRSKGGSPMPGGDPCEDCDQPRSGRRWKGAYPSFAPREQPRPQTEEYNVPELGDREIVPDLPDQRPCREVGGGQ